MGWNHQLGHIDKPFFVCFVCLLYFEWYCWWFRTPANHLGCINPLQILAYSQDFSHQQYHIHKFTIVERILEVAFIYSPKILTIDQKAPTHLTPNQNSLPFLHLSAEISVPKKPGVGIEHWSLRKVTSCAGLLPRRVFFCNKHLGLGGGFNYVYMFISKLGEDEPILTHIFSVGGWFITNQLLIFQGFIDILWFSP